MSEAGMDVQALRERPELPEEVSEVVTAYMVLSRRCTVGFGGRDPITLQAVESYVRMFGQPAFLMEDFLYLLGQLDEEQRGA